MSGKQTGIVMTPEYVIACTMGIAFPVVLAVAGLVALGRAFGWIG